MGRAEMEPARDSWCRGPVHRNPGYWCCPEVVLLLELRAVLPTVFAEEVGNTAVALLFCDVQRRLAIVRSWVEICPAGYQQLDNGLMSPADSVVQWPARQVVLRIHIRMLAD